MCVDARCPSLRHWLIVGGRQPRADWQTPPAKWPREGQEVLREGMVSLLDFPSQNAVRRNHSECVPSGIASPGWGDLTQPLTTQVWSVPHPDPSLGLAWSVPLTHRLAYPPAGPGQPQPGHTPAEAPRPCWEAREPEHATLPAGRACVCPSQTSPSVGTGTHEGPTSWEPWAGGAAWPLGSAACWGECPVALPGDSFRPGLWKASVPHCWASGLAVLGM